jgi:hypothetical protein
LDLSGYHCRTFAFIRKRKDSPPILHRSRRTACEGLRHASRIGGDVNLNSEAELYLAPKCLR